MIAESAAGHGQSFGVHEGVGTGTDMRNAMQTAAGGFGNNSSQQQHSHRMAVETGNAVAAAGGFGNNNSQQYSHASVLEPAPRHYRQQQQQYLPLVAPGSSSSITTEQRPSTAPISFPTHRSINDLLPPRRELPFQKPKMVDQVPAPITTGTGTIRATRGRGGRGRGEGRGRGRGSTARTGKAARPFDGMHMSFHECAQIPTY